MKKNLLLWFVISICATVIKAEISISNPLQSPVVEKVNGYAKFTSNRVYGEPGCPLLPAKKFTFLVPPDADLSSVSFHLQGLEEMDIEGVYKVNPALPPVSREGHVWQTNRNIKDGKDVDIYSSNEYYPNSYIQEISVGEMRCYKLVEVRVYFAKYNCTTGKLKTLTNGRLVLNVKKTDTKTNTGYVLPAKFKKLVKNITVNYDDMAAAYNSNFTFSRNSKYVIITESSIQSASTKLEALVKSKQDHGFDVEVITEDDWGGGTGSDAADNIRDWLKDNYVSNNIEYVLLIGSSLPTSGKIPMYDDAPTDFYYEQLTGSMKDDIMVEVTAGRIPVYDNDISTLDEIITKIIDYENKPKNEIGWRPHTLFAAKPYASDTPGDFMFEAFKEEFIDIAGWPLYRIYDDEYGEPLGDPDETKCTKTSVVNAWKNNDFGVVLWMTHGLATSASDIMNSSSTSDLGDEYPPIVFMGSCLNAKIEEDDNLSYYMLKNAGIGSIAGTRVTWYGDGQKEFEGTSTTQGLMYHFLEGITLDSLPTGDAYVQAVSKCTDKKWWNNIQGYNLYGCPDVGIFTCANSTPIEDISIGPAKKQASVRLIATLTKNNKVHFMVAAGMGNKDVTLTVYDARGNIIHTTAQKKYVMDSNKLNKLYTWDLNKSGTVSSGVYFGVVNVKDGVTGEVVCVRDKFVLRK